MIANIRCLIKACQELDIPFETFHTSKNVVLVAKKHLFTNWSTPLISHSLARLFIDKDFTYTFCQQILTDSIQMPFSKAYLTPHIEQDFQPELQFYSTDEIITDISKNFVFPLIVKRNSGTHGEGVYKVSSIDELSQPINNIFNENNKNWDYVALVQTYIEAKAEFRLIVFNNNLELTYLKDISQAKFEDNLSPLHWRDAKATLITEESLLNQFKTFITPLTSKGLLPYAGLDLILDKHNQFWLIEINGSPGFDLFTKNNGDDLIVTLYKKILKFLVLKP